MKVFVSYRRRDVGGYAGRLTDALVQRLGPKHVFHDVTAIAPGVKFATRIDRALAETDAVLAVIGPGWLVDPGGAGSARLFEADDFVRLELSRALARSIPVVPVLVGGAALPAATALPADLAELVERQAVVLHDETWHDDVDGLVRSLRGERAVPRRSRRMLSVGVAVVVLAAAGAGAWQLWGRAPDVHDASAPPPCLPTTGWDRIALRDGAEGEVTMDTGRLLVTVDDAWWRANGGTWQVTLRTTTENDTSGPQYNDYWRYDSLVVGQRSFDVACFAASPELIDAGTVGEAMVGFDVSCRPVGHMELVFQSASGRAQLTDAADWGPC